MAWYASNLLVYLQDWENRSANPLLLWEMKYRGRIGTVFHLFYRFCDGCIHVIVCRKTAVNRFHAAFV